MYKAIGRGVVFLPANINKTSAHFLINATKIWFCTAALLIVAFSLIIHTAKLDNTFAGYASSFISFICCLLAGAAAQKARNGGALYTGLIFGAAMTVALLTVGFIIAGGEIEPSGIISVASFSIAGACCGSVFLGGKTRSKKAKKRK